MSARRRRFGTSRALAVALAIALCAAGAVGPLAADISLRWQRGGDEKASLIAGYLVDSGVIADFVALVAANFAFEQPLIVTVGAANGPDYDASTNTIRLPYAYVERAVRAQATLLADEDEWTGGEALAVTRALDMIEYTLYHLLGHALAGSEGLEVEERAEAWSSWAMLGHWPSGAAQWREASTAFARATQRLDGPLEDYWHAHGLHAARERIVDCWIIGRDPALAITSRHPAASASVDVCRASWSRLDAEARAALGEVLIAGSPLARTPGGVENAVGEGRARDDAE